MNPKPERMHKQSDVAALAIAMNDCTFLESIDGIDTDRCVRLQEWLSFGEIDV